MSEELLCNVLELLTLAGYVAATAFVISIARTLSQLVKVASAIIRDAATVQRTAEYNYRNAAINLQRARRRARREACLQESKQPQSDQVQDSADRPLPHGGMLEGVSLIGFDKAEVKLFSGGQSHKCHCDELGISFSL